MFEYVWKPEKVDLTMKDGSQKIWEPPFEGEVIISAPKYVERIRYMHECGMDISTGEINLGTNDSVVRLEKMVEIARKHIVSVKLKKPDGTEITDKEMLEYDAEGGTVLIHIAQRILQGFSLGECSRKS